MNSAESLALAGAEIKTTKLSAFGAVRLILAALVLAAYWAFSFQVYAHEMSMFGRFVWRVLADLLLLMFFLGWWFSNRRMSWRQRCLDFGVAAVSFVAIGLLCDKTIWPLLLLSGVPFLVTIGTVWAIVSNPFSAVVQRRGLRVLICLTWAAFLPFRWDGLDGGQHNQISLRWTPTAELLFLAEHAKQSAAIADHKPDVAAKPLVLQPGDWPRFRGPSGDNQVHGTQIGTAWDAQPPKQIWRHRIGPAWSSMIVVDGRLFTQEQRGDSEAVVCYDAATGNEIWAHLDNGRFSENLSGSGPRATPTYADGRIYTLGGFGLANCLDAATGRTIWSRLLYAPTSKTNPPTAETNGAVPQWGVSSSPLVVGDAAIFFTAATPDKELLALSAADGKLKWTAPTGQFGVSHASPTLVSFAGRSLAMMSTNQGLAAVDPATGRAVWQFAKDYGKMFAPIAQPQPVGDGRFVIHSPRGLTLIRLSQHDGEWTATQLWESMQLKPSLNDFVVQDGAIYGFDDGIFCCLDLKSGKRRWKAGRYGHGQVLLLADQKLLLVMSETGEAVLLSASREKHDELGRFQTISGKTWNHPIIVHDRLYVRNAEEMACYELPSAKASPKVAAAK